MSVVANYLYPFGHERAHGEQFSEAIKSTLTVGSMFQTTDAKGNKTETNFTGTIDKILDQASAMYDKVKKESPDAVKGVSKKRVLRQYIYYLKNSDTYRDK